MAHATEVIAYMGQHWPESASSDVAVRKRKTDDISDAPLVEVKADNVIPKVTMSVFPVVCVHGQIMMSTVKGVCDRTT